MSEIKDGGPAFPTAYYETEHGDRVWSNGGIPGMGLRDYFAAKAMQGLLANPGGPIQANGINGWNFTNCSLNDVAELSRQFALSGQPHGSIDLAIEYLDLAQQPTQERAPSLPEGDVKVFDYEDIAAEQLDRNARGMWPGPLYVYKSDYDKLSARALSIAPQEIAVNICRSVSELPDRNSPEDQPEMMLVSETELIEIVVRSITEAAARPTPAQGETK